MVKNHKILNGLDRSFDCQTAFEASQRKLRSIFHYTQKVDENTFPLISKILKLLMLIPATAATFENAHSWLKFVKSDLRSTMSDDCINALIMLYINQLWSSHKWFCKKKSPRKVISKSSRMKNFDHFS